MEALAAPDGWRAYNADEGTLAPKPWSPFRGVAGGRNGTGATARATVAAGCRPGTPGWLVSATQGPDSPRSCC